MTTTARSRAAYISISMLTCAAALGCAGTVEDGNQPNAPGGTDESQSADELRRFRKPRQWPWTAPTTPVATTTPPETTTPPPSEVPSETPGSETPSAEGPEATEPESPAVDPVAPVTPEAPAPNPSEQVGNTPMPLEPEKTPECPNIGLDAPKVHYVCDCAAGADASCKPGNDSAAGTKDAPFKTYQRARQAFSSMNAGETVAFCRGGSVPIDGDRRWVNAKCKAGSPCVVRDYDPSAGTKKLERPILTAAEGDGFAFDDSANADHEEGYTFLNLDIRSTSGGESGNGFFVYNDLDDVLVCNASLSGFSIGFHAAGSNAAASSSSDAKNSRVVLSNSQVFDNGDQGYLGGGDGCGVQYSKFENNGFKMTVLNHNIYFSPRGADGMFALHNDLYRSAIVDGKCEGVSLVVHGQLTNLRIEGNDIREDLGAASDGCWGIAVDTGYGGESEGFKNVAIRGNTVTNVGNLGIGLNACQDCVIENNVVVQEQDIESTLIATPDRSRDDNDQSLGKVTVRNNTLFARSAKRVTGVSLGGEANGHVAVSNALLSQGKGEFICFDYDLADSAYQARDNNLCHAAGSSSWLASTTLSAFRNTAKADTLSLDADPLFASTVAPYDFTPKAGSPLLDKGHSLSASSDLVGVTRGSKPDIGAIER